MVAIVASDANNFRRVDWGKQRAPGQRKMVHSSRGDVFPISTRVLRRGKEKAGNLLRARYGFYETVVRLVV